MIVAQPVNRFETDGHRPIAGGGPPMAEHFVAHLVYQCKNGVLLPALHRGANLPVSIYV